MGTWLDDYKEYLEQLTETTDKTGKKVTPVIKDYDDMSSDTVIDFIITLQKGALDDLESAAADYGCNGLEKMFKLFTTNSTTNMHLFDADDKLKKYDNVVEIIDDYFVTRLQMYQVRKNYLIKAITEELVLLSNKVKYIKEVLEGSVDLRRKKKEEVSKMLADKGYNIIDEDADFKYLTKLPMDSVSEENIDKLEKEHMSKINELNDVNTISIQQMWLKELDILEIEYLNYKEIRSRGSSTTKKAVKTVVKKTKLTIV